MKRDNAAERARQGGSSTQSSRKTTPPKRKLEETPAPKPHTQEEAKITDEILSFRCYY